MGSFVLDGDRDASLLDEQDEPLLPHRMLMCGNKKRSAASVSSVSVSVTATGNGQLTFEIFVEHWGTLTFLLPQYVLRTVPAVPAYQNSLPELKAMHMSHQQLKKKKKKESSKRPSSSRQVSGL